LGLLDLRLAILIFVVAAAAITIERLLSTYLSRFSKRAKLEPHTANNLIITTRIIILLAAVAAIADIGGLPPDLILSISAIGGAAVGFASQKTLGNIIAGIFLLAAHPFKVGDYVRLGTVEGIVQEITLNYTKVFTSANNTILVSNLQILDRDITNFSVEMEKTSRAPGIYCYTFEVGFDHSVPTQKINEIFEAVFKNHLMELPKKPEYTLARSGIERVYLVYLYVRQPNDIFKFKTQIAEEIFALWDQERTKTKP